MSARICYRITSIRDPRLPITAPLLFIDQMRRAFGDYPWRLQESDLPKVQGMEAACGGEGRGNPFSHVVNVLRLHGSVEIYPEF